jgi:putative endonuclease
MKTGFVYILASKINGTLYIGVTSHLTRRIQEHQQGLVEGFTRKYQVHRLVYYESTSDMSAALRREKQLKSWKHLWKIRLIEEHNPQWDDLSFLFQEPTGSRPSPG